MKKIRLRLHGEQKKIIGPSSSNLSTAFFHELCQNKIREEKKKLLSLKMIQLHFRKEKLVQLELIRVLVGAKSAPAKPKRKMRCILISSRGFE